MIPGEGVKEGGGPFLETELSNQAEGGRRGRGKKSSGGGRGRKGERNTGGGEVVTQSKRKYGRGGISGCKSNTKGGKGTPEGGGIVIFP